MTTRRCPDHSTPGTDEFNAWPCPDTCPHFQAEIERRIDDIQIAGNYIRTWTDDNGTFWKQTFRNHKPIDEPHICTWMNK